MNKGGLMTKSSGLLQMAQQQGGLEGQALLL
jgi:hypothetical protein